MSLGKSTWICCDNLDCHEMMEFGHLKYNEVVNAAKNRYGWITLKGKHYCDECKEQALFWSEAGSEIPMSWNEEKQTA